MTTSATVVKFIYLNCNVHNAGDSEPIAAAAVFEALLKILVNAVAVVPTVTASARQRVAVCIYRRAALFNHACIPNVIFGFRCQRLVVTTAREVSRGERLLHCYGPQVFIRVMSP